AVGAMPNTDEYRQALRLFADPAEYPIFPFFTANQKDKAAAAAAGQPGSNNFSTINSTVQFRLYSSVLRNYPNQWMSAEDYKKLLYWNTWAQYVGGNTQWPDANEFWADYGSGVINYRSWIHHNILGSSNWTVIEDVMGLRPRNDKQVELSPIGIGWSHFAANNLRYRNADLSIVWDDPADGVVRYSGIPQGYSIFMNGTRVATVDRLVRLVWNPDTGAVTFPAGGGATVQYSQAYSGLQTPTQVTQNSAQMVDIFNKAGVDLTASLPNLAQGASTSTSYASAAGAVDGFPINEPIWGTYGSPNATDWLTLNLGAARTVDEVRLWFRNDRATNRYRQPASYQIQYLNGSTWTTVASSSSPQANYNVIRFPAVSATQLRVQVTHASGFKTGVTEVKAYNRGGVVDPPPVTNKALSATPSASYTSSWESVAALNDGIDPPSSNDTVNRRWGTWPNTGSQWAELTWPSAQSLTSADVYFFDDNGGVRLPASWKLQSWNGSAYVDVAGASGYPTVLNQYNHVTFSPVSTTRLRVLLTSGTASVGLLEVKAF
ncbi:MAG: discoidin domain-containing protein, partial [Actinoplanes sp.]